MPTSLLTPPRPTPPRHRPWGAGLLAVLAGLSACRDSPPAGYLGYLEAEWVYVAAPVAGRLERLAVTRGQEVLAGEVLFELERAPEETALAEAAHLLERTRARRDNLGKGQRPSELAVLEAQEAQARAELALAEAEWRRREPLRQQGVIAEEEWDLARARRDAAAAQVAALQARLATARLGAREDEIRAAEAEVAAAQAAWERARWAVEQKRQHAPIAGRVQDTLYREGEWVPAGRPVVVLFAPEQLKARFFVPETALAAVRVGQRVTVHGDGWPAPVPAVIRFKAERPEYTPPVIYSRANRAKLVYLIEAEVAPEAARALPVGQPVEVRLVP